MSTFSSRSKSALGKLPPGPASMTHPPPNHTLRTGTGSNPYLTPFASTATGGLTVAGIFKNRPDSRTGYLPNIDIPTVHASCRRPPESLYDLHSKQMQSRSLSAQPSLHPPGVPSEVLKRQRAQFERQGHNLPMWRTGPLESYRCTLPQEGNMVHPGLTLPAPLISSQSLFGPIMNKTGVPPHLRSVAGSMPDAAPRFMTHDVVSTSSSTYSNFRKTTVSLGVVPSEMDTSEYMGRYQPPGTPYRRQTNNGARGSPMNVHGRSSLAMCSGSSRAFTGKDT